MQKELELADYVDIIVKRKAMILCITLVVVIGVLIYSFILPDLYESEAIIKIGNLDGKFLIAPGDSLTMLESSLLVQPIIDKHFNEGHKPFIKDFIEENIFVEIISTKIGQQVTSTSSVNVRLQTYDPQRAKLMLSELVDSFVDLGNKVLLEKYNESLTSLKSELDYRNQNIDQIEGQIFELNQQLDILSLSSQSTSEILLVRELIDSYETRLLEEKNKRFAIEIRIKDIRYKMQRLYDVRELDLEDSSDLDYFKVTLTPEVSSQRSSPNFAKNLLVALIFGLVFSVSLSLFLEFINKR